MDKQTTISKYFRI